MSETEDFSSASEDEAGLSRAERKLKSMLFQSTEDPWQRDVVNMLPEEEREIYRNPDLLVTAAEEEGNLSA